MNANQTSLGHVLGSLENKFARDFIQGAIE
jgi:hypothetical protein